MQVLHGDLKSSNVLVDRSFGGRIADFGLAVRAAGGGSSVSSPLWMSPENLLGGICTAAGDVWSFGVVVNEVTGSCLPYKRTWI